MKNIQQIKQAKDPDLFVGMLANDPKHLARARAKAQRVERARRRPAAKARADANMTAAVGICSGAIGLVSMALALTLV